MTNSNEAPQRVGPLVDLPLKKKKMGPTLSIHARGPLINKKAITAPKLSV